MYVTFYLDVPFDTTIYHDPEKNLQCFCCCSFAFLDGLLKLLFLKNVSFPIFVSLPNKRSFTKKEVVFAWLSGTPK